MDQAPPPPLGASPDPAGAPGDSPRDADPLAEIAGHCASAWQSLCTHAALVVDEAVGRLYGVLIMVALAMAGLAIIVLLMTMGCYYLVSGIASGMTRLVGSVWIGHAVAGAAFLFGPPLIGYSIAAICRRTREQRMVSAYHRLQDQAVAP